MSPFSPALLAVTDAGLAIAAMPRSSVPSSLRILGAREGFLDLPEVELALIGSEGSRSAAIDALAACIDIQPGPPGDVRDNSG